MSKTRFNGFLVIKGGLWEAGSETNNTSTGTKMTDTTFKPVGLMTGAVLRETAGRDDQVSGSLQIGATDGTTDICCGTSIKETALPTVIGVSADNTACCKMQDPDTPTGILSEAVLDSFNDTSFTLDWTTSDGTARKFIWLAVGEADPAAEPPAAGNFTLSGRHATELLDKKKKRDSPPVLVGPRREQLIPLEFTFLTKSTVVRFPKETMKMKSTLVRKESANLNLKSTLTRTVSGKIHMASILLAKAEYLLKLEGKTLKSYSARTDVIKEFLLRKLGEINDNDDK